MKPKTLVERHKPMAGRKRKLQTCSICQGPIAPKGDWMLGNNAQPVNNGRCCDTCNTVVVIPARLRAHYRYKAGLKPKE